MSSSFYIESLIQNSKAKPTTTTAETRRSFEAPVPCSCCWTPSTPDPSGLCQLCIPPAPSVHPFMHVRSAASPTAAFYTRNLSKDHPHLPQHYPVSQEERLHLASYGNYIFRKFDTLPRWKLKQPQTQISQRQVFSLVRGAFTSTVSWKLDVILDFLMSYFVFCFPFSCVPGIKQP